MFKQGRDTPKRILSKFALHSSRGQEQPLLIKKRTGCHEAAPGIATLTRLDVHGVKDVDALSCSSKGLLVAKPAS